MKLHPFLKTLAVGAFLFAGALATSTLLANSEEKTEQTDSPHYWTMTYEEILASEDGNPSKAWNLYDFWVLRHLYLEGVVSDAVVHTLSDKINVLNEISDEPISLVISSPGGSVFSGLMLYNSMMTSKAPVNTVCNGMAASMAAVLLTAGVERSANPGCLWMVHEIGAGRAPGGQTTDFIKWADFAVELENNLYRIVSVNTGLSMTEVETLGNYESFYSAEDLVRLGVVDKVLGRSKTVAKRDIPEDLLPVNRMTKNISEKINR